MTGFLNEVEWHDDMSLVPLAHIFFCLNMLVPVCLSIYLPSMYLKCTYIREPDNLGITEGTDHSGP